MTPVQKKLWVEALRSGKYEQGRGKLKTQGLTDETTTYCCLGVACEIGITSPLVNGSFSSKSFVSYDFLSANDQTHLAIMNDGRLDPWGEVTQKRYTFEEIADYIEKSL